MFSKLINACVCLSLLGSSLTLADDKEAMIASAESAGPPASNQEIPVISLSQDYK